MILAHAGHWISGLLYALPVVIVLIALGIQSLRDRKRQKPEQENGETRRNI
jgi:hypothetical protein